MQTRNVGPNAALKSGHPVLEFTNTVSNHASQQPGESLFHYEDLLAWAERVGLLNGEQAHRYARRAAAQPAAAAAIFKQSLELREAIYRVFAARSKGKSPADEDLAIFNSLLASLTSGARLEYESGRFAWQWSLDETALEAPLWLIVLSAVDLMTSEAQQWVGQCADEDGCGWLFLDTSKNHSRRWCDINDCGNRAKQRRYQKRAATQKSPTLRKG